VATKEDEDHNKKGNTIKAQFELENEEFHIHVPHNGA
jgi:hypothetical protein